MDIYTQKLSQNLQTLSGFGFSLSALSALIQTLITRCSYAVLSPSTILEENDSCAPPKLA